MKKSLIILIFILAVMNFYPVVKAEDQVVSPGNMIFEGLINSYQNFISPITYSSCPMHPTCSNYAEQSFQDNNFLKAILLTTDRLFRCENDLDNYRQIRLNGTIRYEHNLKENSVNYIKNISNKDPIFEKNNKIDELNSEIKLFNFADQLKIEGEYDQAETEYRRFLSYFPDSNYRGKALNSLINILVIQEKYEEVIEKGISILNSEDKIHVNKEQLKYQIGYSYLNLKSFDMARDYLNKIEMNQDLKSKASMLIGFSYAQNEDWETAIDNFKQIDASSPYHDKAQESISLAESGKNLDYKNPKLAAGLSIIPGLGYLYSGYERTALSSFVVNGLLFEGARRAFKNDNQALGTIVAVFNLGFYGGNIYGSYRTAEDQNINIKEEHLLKFEFNF